MSRKPLPLAMTRITFVLFKGFVPDERLFPLTVQALGYLFAPTPLRHSKRFSSSYSAGRDNPETVADGLRCIPASGEYTLPAAIRAEGSWYVPTPQPRRRFVPGG